MRLIPVTTQKQYIPSADYLEQPQPSIDRFSPELETRLIFRDVFLHHMSIHELYEAGLAGTSITLQPHSLVAKLETLYTFDNPDEIKKFLLVNDYLIEILLEAPSHIYKVFGEVPIYLELHRDPEEGWDELFIIIKSPYGVEEAARLERKLAEDWFLERMKDTKGKLNLTEEPL